MTRLWEVLVAGGWPLLAVILSVNLFAFLQVGWDKRQARLARRRVPESRLAAPALFGGLPGLWFAMRTFRHKTRKRSFQWRVALCTAGCAAWLVVLALALNDWRWQG